MFYMYGIKSAFAASKPDLSRFPALAEGGRGLNPRSIGIRTFQASWEGPNDSRPDLRMGEVGATWVHKRAVSSGGHQHRLPPGNKSKKPAPPTSIHSSGPPWSVPTLAVSITESGVLDPPARPGQPMNESSEKAGSLMVDSDRDVHVTPWRSDEAGDVPRNEGSLVGPTVMPSS